MQPAPIEWYVVLSSDPEGGAVQVFYRGNEKLFWRRIGEGYPWLQQSIKGCTLQGVDKKENSITSVVSTCRWNWNELTACDTDTSDPNLKNRFIDPQKGIIDFLARENNTRPEFSDFTMDLLLTPRGGVMGDSLDEKHQVE